MLKINDIQINKIKLEARNLLVKLEDNKVHPELYTFFKKRLKTYKFYINREYALKSEMEYEESSQRLSIVINIIIPEYLIPKDPEKATETIMDPIDVFQKFYEVETLIYKRNHQKISIF
jgi:hypothetical protein